MNHQDFIDEWTNEGNGVFSFGVCSVQLRVEGNNWDAALPGGKHIKGVSATSDEAKQAAFMAFVAFAVRRLIEHAVNLPAHAPA